MEESKREDKVKSPGQLAKELMAIQNVSLSTLHSRIAYLRLEQVERMLDGKLKITVKLAKKLAFLSDNDYTIWTTQYKAYMKYLKEQKYGKSK